MMKGIGMDGEGELVAVIWGKNFVLVSFGAVMCSVLETETLPGAMSGRT